MSYNSIKTFHKGRLNILLSDIDVSWLNKYEKWLGAKGNKETTICVLFRILRSAYNCAEAAKCTRKSCYPFSDFKVSKFNVKTKKRSISKGDIQKTMMKDLSSEHE